MPRIQFRTKLRLINDPGVLRKFVYEERVKCQFRELCEHRVRTDDTRQVTESQFTEAKMFSRLRRSNSIFHFEKSPQSRALCLWFVCILNRMLWPEIPVCRLKLPCVGKKLCKSQDFAFCSDDKIRLRRIGGCHARSPFFLSSTALALNRTFIASCTVDTTDKSQSSRHIPLDFTPLDFTLNASCNPPEMQANALGRTARRSVPAAFVGCVWFAGQPVAAKDAIAEGLRYTKPRFRFSVPLLHFEGRFP
jgi:hypothetical protein